MTDTRECEQCGAAFAPRREHARFCSARCRAAWNRHHTSDATAQARALDWSVTAMRDTTDRLTRIGARDSPRALALVGEAVWWVTIVDGTLVRHHPEIYDAVMAASAAADRRLTEGILGGLRFVRNQMGNGVDHVDFVHLAADLAGPGTGRAAAWTWKSVPEPEVAALPPRAQEWELIRYRAYQGDLVGRTIEDTFGRAVAFLRRSAARAADISDPSAAAGAR